MRVGWQGLPLPSVPGLGKHCTPLGILQNTYWGFITKETLHPSGDSRVGWQGQTSLPARPAFGKFARGWAGTDPVGCGGGATHTVEFEGFVGPRFTGQFGRDCTA